MTTIFTKIINHELPGFFLWRDQQCVSFLSISPVRDGHALVVPIREVDHWLDLDASEIAHLSQVGKNIGLALQDVYKPQRIGMLIAGFEVPHTHLHIMCIDNMDNMDLMNATDADPEELNENALKVRNALSARGFESVSDS